MSKSLHRSLEAKLAALDGPEWDSSDDEENVQKISQTEERRRNKKKSKTSSSTLDRISTKKSDADKTSRKTAVAKTKPSSVIYLGHIPHGFEEGEIKGFLAQFGSIRKLRLSRSKKTGNSRGYAFVEFVDPEVAAIVADTMSGYFLMEKRLVCHVMPRDKCHPNLFDGHNKKFVKVDWKGVNREQVNKPRTAEGMKKITDRLVRREASKRKKLEALGIDYDFPGYKAGVDSSKEAEDCNGKRERKSSKDEGEHEPEQEQDRAKTPKRRERKGSEVSTDGESSVKKSAKKKSSKKRRKESAELEAIMETDDMETPKKSISARSAKTEVKKSKKTKKTKKRRDSVP